MKKIIVIGILGMALVFGVVLFCAPTQAADEGAVVSGPFDFSMGQTVAELNRNQYADGRLEDKTMLNSTTWRVGKRQVNFIHGQYSFSIPDAMGVLAFDDKEFEQNGIYSYTVSVDFGDDVSHEVARDKLYQFFADLKSRGWQPYYYIASPRTQGSALWFDKETLYQDIAVKPNMVDWMDDKALSNDTYLLYADGVVLVVNIYRDYSRLQTPNGAYYMSLEFSSLDYVYRSGLGWYFDGRDLSLLKNKAWIAERVRMMAEGRKEKEAKALQRGLSIDKNYIDPVPKWAQP